MLRFALPPSRQFLGDDPSLPTCIKVGFNGTDEAGKSKLLEKSYSPVSHPARENELELLVKAYPPRPGGGVGAYICSLQVGDTMEATLKSKRIMHGSASVLGRWKHLGLLGGGTGIAPLIQIARLVLEAPGEATKVHVLSVHRREEDILMRDAWDELVAAHPTRLVVHHTLTAPPAGWRGLTGRGTVEMARAALPPPKGDGSTMVLVCGTDGFVSTWGGPVGRAPKKADGSKGAKIQGPLTGLLADVGFAESEVFKY